MSNENPTPVDNVDDRDRPLQMHEVRSLVEDLRSANVHVYTKQAWRRDRTIGWILVVGILGALGWMVWSNYVNTQSLRQNIYQSCLTANQRVQAERELLGTVVNQTTDKAFRSALSGTLSGLVISDCAGKYLN